MVLNRNIVCCHDDRNKVMYVWCELGCEGDVEGGGESMWKDKSGIRFSDAIMIKF